jgi:hypothetical protein
MASDAIKKRLNQLHDEDHLSWRKIAEMPEFKKIPAGSLCSFAKGNWEPKKNKEHRRILGLSEIIEIETYRNPTTGRYEKRGEE